MALPVCSFDAAVWFKSKPAAWLSISNALILFKVQAMLANNPMPAKQVKMEVAKISVAVMVLRFYFFAKIKQNVESNFCGISNGIVKVI